MEKISTCEICKEDRALLVCLCIGTILCKLCLKQHFQSKDQVDHTFGPIDNFEIQNLLENKRRRLDILNREMTKIAEFKENCFETMKSKIDCFIVTLLEQVDEIKHKIEHLAKEKTDAVEKAINFISKSSPENKQSTEIFNMLELIGNDTSGFDPHYMQFSAEELPKIDLSNHFKFALYYKPICYPGPSDYIKVHSNQMSEDFKKILLRENSDNCINISRIKRKDADHVGYYLSLNPNILSLKLLKLKRGTLYKFGENLGRLEDLEDLEISGIFDFELKDLISAFKGIKQLNSLVKLELHAGIMFASEGEILSQAMSNFVNLKELSLAHTALPISVLNKFSEVFHKLVSLETLNLDDCSLNMTNITNISPQFRSLVSLRSLTLSNNTLGEQGVVQLARDIAYMRKLERLDLQNCKILASGAAHFSSILKTLEGLKVLLLSGNQISHHACQAISSGVAELKNIEFLDLSNNSIKSPGANLLAPAFKFLSNLMVLNLSHNEIKSSGLLGILNSADQMLELQSLNLKGNGLSSDSGEYLGLLMDKCPKLVDIDLSYNQLGAEGVKLLSDHLPRFLEIINFD